MSTTCASSLALPVLNPKVLSFHNKPTICFSLPSSKTIPLTRLVGSSPSSPLPSRFARSVAFAAEYGQEEESASFGDVQEQRSFSPDLKLFVGNLAFSVDSSQLAGLFQDAGNVEVVEVIYDKVTGRSRGFAFVTMSSVEEAEAAARQFDGYEFEGRALRVNAGPPPQRDLSRPPRGSSFGGGGGGSFGGRSNDAASSDGRCYVGNLSWGVDNSALESLFSEQGDVKEARVVYDRETGRSRGFGFVTYGSASEANSAIDALDGVELDGRSIRVSMAEARPPRRQF